MRQNVNRFERDTVLRKPRFRFFAGASAVLVKELPVIHDSNSFRPFGNHILAGGWEDQRAISRMPAANS